MDAFFFRTAFCVFFLLLAGACMAKEPESEPEPPVAVNVQGLPTHTANRIREHAAKGLTELRRYLERSRVVLQLRLENVVRMDPAEASKRDTAVAAAEPRAKD